MAAGMLFRRSGVLPGDAHKGINAWIIYLALPAVSFKYLPHIEWSRDLLLPVLGPVVVWLGGWMFSRLYVRTAHLEKATEGGLKLVAGLSNTSFVGFPLIAAYFGEKSIGIGVICDQMTFTLLSTAGIVVAINSSGRHSLSAKLVAQRLFRFPPFLGCIAALTLPHFINLTPFDPLFEKLAGTVGPLALFSIGLQLRFDGWRDSIKHVSATLFYKLILAPLLVLGVVLLTGITSHAAEITVFEAAMPTLLTSGIVADEYGLHPKLSNLIIGIGILLSLLTTGLWYFLIQIAL